MVAIFSIAGSPKQAWMHLRELLEWRRGAFHRPPQSDDFRWI